jgi:hypothetical protein
MVIVVIMVTIAEMIAAMVAMVAIVVFGMSKNVMVKLLMKNCVNAFMLYLYYHI